MFYRFEPLRNRQGHAILAFGPAFIRIDRFGRWLGHDIQHPNARTVADCEAVLGSVRDTLPTVVRQYKDHTGYLKFGTPGSLRRWDLICYIAEALNTAIDGPASPPDAGVFG